MKNRNWIQFIPVVLYSLVILYITLFTRTAGTERILKGLFWEASRGMWQDILLNILLFIPLGIFLGMATDSWKSVFYGIGLSILIEVTQYVFCLGYCEVDDVLNNSIGTIIGILIVLIVIKWGKTVYKHFGKRIIDIILGICAFPFVLIIIAVFGPIIYFTDKGPIFYNANRLGRKGKIYKMFKLRSMRVNAPDIRNADGSTFNGENDPRVTKIGRFMRKTSIDEFPQFLNVLIGDMSIIGPRPNVPTVPYDELSEIEKKRLEVKPGITGYNQAYYRNSVSSIEKYKHDVFYVENLTFLMDVKVFFHTIISVLKKENINAS